MDTKTFANDRHEHIKRKIEALHNERRQRRQQWMEADLCLASQIEVLTDIKQDLILSARDAGIEGF